MQHKLWELDGDVDEDINSEQCISQGSLESQNL